MKRLPASLLTTTLLLTASLHLGMGRHGQYDEEAREEARIAKVNHAAEEERQSAARGFADGVKTIAAGPAHLLSDTASGTMDEKSVDGTIGGVSSGSEKLLDNTLKGTVKVATLGMGELKSYEVEEPEAGSGDMTKIKFKIPGT